MNENIRLLTTGSVFDYFDKSIRHKKSISLRSNPLILFLNNIKDNHLPILLILFRRKTSYS